MDKVQRYKARIARLEAMRKMRRQGKTYKEIADKYGISKQRAWILLNE